MAALQQQYNSQGWDIIAAITQDKLNVQLAKIPNVPINKTMSFPLFGTEVQVTLDIVFGAPQVSVMKGAGHLVNINLPISGTVKVPSEVITMPSGQYITVTTDLAQIQAEIQNPNSNNTVYELVLNLESKDAVANLTLGIPNGDLAFLLKVLMQVIRQDIGNGHAYKVASFSLTSAQVSEYKAIVPHTADFSFVEDTTNPGRSNLLVLLLTTSTSPGNMYFNGPLLPPDQDAAVLMSNRLFLSQYVMPPLLKQIEGKASNSSAVASQISLNLIDPNLFLYQIANSSDIGLKEAHDPWIATIQAYIDTSKQALLLYLDGKADVTFLNIHVDAWDKSWHQFKVDDQENISMPQTAEEQDKSTHMEWWKWLIAFLISPIVGIVVAIVYAVVSDDNPSIGGTFKDVGKNLVEWPNQKEVKLKQIISPNHVVLFVDVDFK